ncbi:hypothetical protein BH11PSE2_BH11PSE2_03480 [soil metagenome]
MRPALVGLLAIVVLAGCEPRREITVLAVDEVSQDQATGAYAQMIRDGVFEHVTRPLPLIRVRFSTRRPERLILARQRTKALVFDCHRQDGGLFAVSLVYRTADSPNHFDAFFSTNALRLKTSKDKAAKGKDEVCLAIRFDDLYVGVPAEPRLRPTLDNYPAVGMIL